MNKPSPPLPHKIAPPPTSRTKPKKKFRAEKWGGDNEGEKIILYSDLGMGKTTLASMLPKPRFIGLDDGGRKIKHPVTGEDLEYVPEIETYQDVRDVLTQKGLFDDDESVVIDTGTILQGLGEKHMLANTKTEGGKFVDSITDYGWGAGYRHLYETMHHILADLDAHVRQGKNVVIVCQMKQESIANAAGEDYLKDVPKLQGQYGKVCPAIWSDYAEWADHVFKIGYAGVVASKKKAISSDSRVIYVHPEIHFVAKSRTIPREYPLLTFDSPDDDTIWQYLFNEVWKDEKENM